MKNYSTQTNALRTNLKPDLVAYLDAVIEEQDKEIHSLLKQNLALQKEIAECRLQIQDINRHLDDNAEYSLTRNKIVRLMKKMGIYDGNE